MQTTILTYPKNIQKSLHTMKIHDRNVGNLETYYEKGDLRWE